MKFYKDNNILLKNKKPCNYANLKYKIYLNIKDKK